MDLITIDRKSVKRNPNAGSTSTVVPMNEEIRFNIVGIDDLPEPFRNRRDVFVTESCSGDEKECEGLIYHRGVIDEFFKYRDANDDFKFHINIKLNNNVINHFPSPTWNYKYNNDKVKCDSCKKLIKHEDIEIYTDDDYDDIEICPNCKSGNVFEYKFERIEDVLKELNLT